MVNLAPVNVLSSKLAAKELGCTVAHFHRLIARYDIKPVVEADGIRGAKFWHPIDIARLKTVLGTPDGDGKKAS